MSTVLYLYGYVPTDSSVPGDALPGIDGQAVRLLDLGAFHAAYSELEADRYGEELIAEQLHDLPWVGRHGALHETVVTWFSDHATILPARLLTIFSTADKMREASEGRRAEIEDKLARFRKVREWDLKVSYDVDRLTPHLGEYSTELAAEQADIEAAPPGRRYLLQRRYDEAVKKHASRVARSVAAELLEELSRLADEVSDVEIPARNDELPVVLNAALLVNVERADELVALASAKGTPLEEHGLHAALTGPWAPYRFVGQVANA